MHTLKRQEWNLPCQEMVTVEESIEESSVQVTSVQWGDDRYPAESSQYNDDGAAASSSGPQANDEWIEFLDMPPSRPRRDP